MHWDATCSAECTRKNVGNFMYIHYAGAFPTNIFPVTLCWAAGVPLASRCIIPIAEAIGTMQRVAQASGGRWRPNALFQSPSGRHQDATGSAECPPKWAKCVFNGRHVDTVCIVDAVLIAGRPGDSWAGRAELGKYGPVANRCIISIREFDALDIQCFNWSLCIKDE